MTRRPHECQARQYGDQIICAACGLNWDANDPEPPACKSIDRRTRKAQAVAKFEAENAAPKRQGLPDELPADLAAEMFRVLQYARGTGSDGIEAMRRAYRVLLDRVEI